MPTAAHQTLVLIGFLILCLLTGFLGSLFTTPSIGEWYAGLSKPAWIPPNWLFGPVWTALYILMGIAAWLVWREHDYKRVAVPLTLFFIQLALNLFWTILFFGRKLILPAFIEIILLWIFILLTTVYFWRIRPAAGALMLPYLLWVAYASALNYEIWRLNS